MRIIGKEEHLPVEIFGFVPENRSEKAQEHRRSKKCPFIRTSCVKEQYRTEEPPTGSCMVSHLGKPHMICPKRFYEDGFRILWETVDSIFGSDVEAVLISEVSLRRREARKKIGVVDWVAVKLRSGEEIEDFIGIEVMADQTTSTGKLVEALKEFDKTNRFSKTHYGYGLNTYMQVKTFFTQCLAKGRLFNRWSKKYVWIMQDVLFENWIDRFNLKLKRGVDDENFIFKIYDPVYNEKMGRYQLNLKETYSATFELLLEAYAAPMVEIPDMNEFLVALRTKIPRGLRKRTLDLR